MSIQNMISISDREEISKITKKPIKTTKTPTYNIDFYEEIDKEALVIIGVSASSSGYGEVISAITVVDNITKKVIADFNSSTVRINEISEIVNSLATDTFPNCVICIEKNSYGMCIMDGLINFYDSRSKLYYEEVDGPGIKKIKKYGVEDNRKVSMTLSELLFAITTKHKELIAYPQLTKECGGNYIHISLMSFLVASYVCCYGNNLEQFKIERWDL